MIQWGALVLMTVGVLGKFGAFFVSIPDPIVGGVFMVMFGMIAAVGISNPQFADMNSSRNLFVVGFSIAFGLALPHYMSAHPNAIKTGTIWGNTHISLMYQSLTRLEIQHLLIESGSSTEISRPFHFVTTDGVTKARMFCSLRSLLFGSSRMVYCVTTLIFAVSKLRTTFKK